MTEEAIREHVLRDECLKDVVDTGRMFDGYKIYWGVPQDRFCNGGSYGEPIYYLVKGDEIRYPDVDEEYDQVLAIVNGVALEDA